MLMIISPAKKLDYETPIATKRFSRPDMLDDSETLIDVLTTKSPHDLQKLMGISPALAELNTERYHAWAQPFNPSNSRQSAYAFKGDTYVGLEVESFTEKQLDYAQEHLRILSGLYGVLRPLDLMQAYRLEMGTKLAVGSAKNLYEFWDEKITDKINNQLEKTSSKLLINLASNEYFKSVKTNEIKAEVITPIFKDWSKNQYKMIGFYAKKARGSMAAWLLKSKAKTMNKLIQFNADGYQYSAELSTRTAPVFLRKPV